MFYSIKSIQKGKKQNAGRNNQGKITIRHKGGGHKRKYIFIDLFRVHNTISFSVLGFLYDANRTAYLAVLRSFKGNKVLFHTILQPKGLCLGAKVNNYFSEDFIGSFSIGSSYYVSQVPVGAVIHNLEFQPLKGGKISRSAGCFSQVIQKKEKIWVKLPSGKVSLFAKECRCTFGSVGNENHHLFNFGKAGRNRWLSKRPTVRGVAINPVDHPHGGGEGKSKIGRVPVNPWGRFKKGKKTR